MKKMMIDMSQIDLGISDFGGELSPCPQTEVPSPSLPQGVAGDFQIFFNSAMNTLAYKDGKRPDALEGMMDQKRKRGKVEDAKKRERRSGSPLGGYMASRFASPCGNC